MKFNINKIKTIIILSIFILPTSACSNYHELNDLGIVTALGIDKLEDEYRVTAQIINTQKADSTNVEFSNFVTLEGYGKTVKEAVDSINKESSRYLYLSHLNLLLIDDNIAKEGIDDVLDVFIREPVSRTDFYVLLAKDDSASDVLQVFTALNSIPAIKIVNSIKQDIITNSNTINLTFLDLLQDIAKVDYSLVIPTVSIIGNTEDGKNEENIKESSLDARLVLSDIAIFKDYLLLDYITNDETIYYNMITNNFEQATLIYQCVDDNYMTIKVDNSSSSISPIYENDEFSAQIDLAGEISIYENNCYLEDDTDIYKLVEEELNKQIKENATSLVDITQEQQTDIFGIGNSFYLNKYKIYKDKDDDWSNIYQNMNITLNTSYILNKKGNEEENIIGDLNAQQ